MANTKAFDPKNMKFRYLGPTGLKVSVLSLGGWLTFGAEDSEVKEVDLTAKVMEEAWSHGINAFDTASVYANGNAEVVMGKAIKQLGWDRDHYVITTKIFFGDGTPAPNGNGLSRKHILECMTRCLKRLQMDHVDVIMAHRSDFHQTPMRETVEAFTHLIRTGKAHVWGTSEWSAFEIEHAHHVADKYNLIPPTADQPQYNMFHRRIESELDPIFKLYNYGTTVWSPLAQGILTGKYNDGIPKGSRYDTISKSSADKFEKEEIKDQIAKVRKLTEIANELGCSMSQLALAWTLQNPNVSTAILGATKPEQVAENCGALDVMDKLESKHLEKIEEILANKPAGPSLYGRNMMQFA